MSDDYSKSATRLSASQIFAYGCVMTPLAVGFAILMMAVPAFYAVDRGIGLAAVGVIFALSRGFDFITDPVIGALSDRFSTLRRIGRKTWVAVGGVMFCAASAILFCPPDTPSPIYLGGAAGFYFLAFTVTDIPLSAIGLEVSNNSQERTQLAASRTFFFIIGGIIGAVIPVIWDDNLRIAFQYGAIIINAMTLCVLPIFMIFAPNKTHAAVYAAHGTSFRALISDPHIARILAVFFVIMVAASLSGALSLLHGTYIIQRPNNVGLFWMASGVGILMGLPIVLWVSARYGKVQIWRWGIASSVILGLPLFAVGTGDSAAMIAISFGFGLCAACDTVMPISMLADHVGERTEKTDFEIAGRVAALKNAVSKASVIGPMIIAFPVLGLVGLTEGSTAITDAGRVITPAQRATLISLYVGVPLALRALAYVLIGRLWASDLIKKIR